MTIALLPYVLIIFFSLLSTAFSITTMVNLRKVRRIREAQRGVRQ